MSFYHCHTAPRDILISSEAPIELYSDMKPFSYLQRVAVITVPRYLPDDVRHREILSHIRRIASLKTPQNLDNEPSLNQILATIDQYDGFKIHSGTIELSREPELLTTSSAKALYSSQNYHATPYKHVAVFSLSWADSDLQPDPRDDVQRFKDCCQTIYKFHTFRDYLIRSPRKNSPQEHITLRNRALKALESFLTEHGHSRENLIIFYYSGH